MAAVLPPVTSRPSYLPLGELPWVRFEEFAHDLIARLPGYSACHRQGTAGQKQRGIDVFADHESTGRWGFSNKRYKQYQPHHVITHISETTYKAEQYIILLSTVASPDVRSEVDKHTHWDLWDAVDLSQKVRDLASANPEAARELVDHHFGSHWRREFLGLSAIGGFLAPSDFFRELLAPGRLFHHAFDLIGRSDRLASLIELVKSTGKRVAILPGIGGIGKTRLLRAFAETVEENAAEPAIRFLVEGIPVTEQGLDELPIRPCVIVVDDAHRCEGLSMLLAYAHRRANLKLLLVTRPHARDRIRVELTRKGFDLKEIEEMPSLLPLSLDEVRALARQALGPDWRHRVDLVDRLAWVTKDCPLATVIGARLLTDNAIPPELLAQDETFRRAVFDRFRDEQLGHLGPEFAPDVARRVLEVLAAIIPIPAIQNQTLLAAIATSIGADPVEITRLVGEFERIGFLIRRGGHLRLIPDVFADHLLAGACLTARNEPTGFAEKMFQSFQQLCPQQVFANLAELDWRVRASSGEELRLLDGLWLSLEDAFRVGTNGVRAHIVSSVMDAAEYQPRRILNFARIAIHDPGADGTSGVGGGWRTHADVLGPLPELLRRCAYTADTLPECLDLLWILCQSQEPTADGRKEHPLTVLQEMAKYKYEDYGQWWMGSEIARHVHQWFSSPEGLSRRTLLLAILDALLAKEGESNWCEGARFRRITFLVPWQEVRETRRVAFSTLGDCLKVDDLRMQLRAIEILERALNGPMPLSGLAITDDVHAGWEPDQLEILELLKDFLSRKPSPLVQLRVLEAVRYQAAYARRPTVQDRAQEVIRHVEDSFDLRLALALLRRSSHWDHTDAVRAQEPGNIGDRLSKAERRRYDILTPEVWQRHPTAEAAFDFLNSFMRSLKDLFSDVDPYRVVWHLFEARPDAPAEFAQLILAQPGCPLESCLGTCLAWVRFSDPSRATTLAGAALYSGSLPAVHAAAIHYCYNWPTGISLTDGDVELLRVMLAHSDARVRSAGLGSLHHLAATDAAMAVELAVSVPVGDATEVAEELARLTESTQPGHLANFSDDHLRTVLRKFDAVGRIDHWISELLRRIVDRMPNDVMDLFFRRMYCAERQGFRTEFDVLPSQGLRHIFEPVVNSIHQPELIRRVRDQAVGESYARWFTLTRLFRAVSGNYGSEGIAALREWLASGDSDRVIAAVRLLEDGGTGFIFDHLDFVSDALTRAESLGAECLDQVRSCFHGQAARFHSFGFSDELSPQHAAQREKVIAIMDQIPRGTQLHRLITEIRQGIENRLRQDEARIDELHE